MEDEGWAGYIWDRSTIRLAVVLVGLLVFAILTSISSYHYNQNNLERRYLEKTASAMLGTKVTIGGLYWRPAENTVALTDIKIANPPGIDIPSAISIRALRMRTDSISPSAMVFNQITIARTAVYLTVGSNTSNLTILHANMDRTTPVLTADGKPFMVVIKDVQTKQGMSMRTDIVPSDRQISPADIEPLHLTGIGEKEKGIPAAQAVTWIIDQIIRDAFITAARSGALESMSKNAVLDIKSNFDMGPDFVDLANRGLVIPRSESGARGGKSHVPR